MGVQISLIRQVASASSILPCIVDSIMVIDPLVILSNLPFGVREECILLSLVLYFALSHSKLQASTRNLPSHPGRLT